MADVRFSKLWPALLLAITGAMIACSGQRAGVRPPASPEDPSKLIRLLEKDLNAARRGQVDILSPTLFAKAEASFNQARRMMSEQRETAAVIDQINQSQNDLSEARDKSQIARSVLADAIKSRELARRAGATNLSAEYAGVEERFGQLTRALENGNLRYVRANNARVSESYRELEIRAIKIQTIGDVRRMLQKADEQRTDQLAPRTYLQAVEKLEAADRFITANPYKKEQMLQMANEARFEAKRHLAVAEFSRRIASMESEQVTLLLEDFLLRISNRLAAPDMRDHPVETQVQSILGAIEAQEKDRLFGAEREKALKNQIDNLNRRLAQSQDSTKKRQLSDADRRKFKQRAGQVESLFDPGEADVYVEDLRVIIRLKSMRFPVGKSVILPENEDLLAKVQQAIDRLDNVDMIIEGHTDNTGSERINEKISEQRADAVRHYLVTRNSLSYDRIIAVGYGSTRPVAPNTSKKGRALNRRIDLIITPHY